MKLKFKLTRTFALEKKSREKNTKAKKINNSNEIVVTSSSFVGYPLEFGLPFMVGWVIKWCCIIRNFLLTHHYWPKNTTKDRKV